MGLIPVVISGVGAIVAAAVVKVIADDAKEWTPWVTRRLLDNAVRRLPEDQRERYAEEWAAHLADIPGVVGKLAVSLQFQIAVFGVREMDAKARLDAWRTEQVAAVEWMRATAGYVLASVEAPLLTNEADEDTLEKRITTMREALTAIIQRHNELEAKRPVLGITVVGAIFMGGRIFSTVRAMVGTTAYKARNWHLYMRRRILRMQGRLDK